MSKNDYLKVLGIEEINSGGCISPSNWTPIEGRKLITSISPIDEEPIAKIAEVNNADYEKIVSATYEAFQEWQMVPAPKRGEIIRQLGLELRKLKEPLAKLLTLENGKIISESRGEVQEMIDICDFAVGLSRQLYGLTMKSEREKHRMYEQWLPLGVVGIITSFNFPMAVWAWNSTIATVCGDTSVWKPSSSTPLCAIAVQKIVNRVLERNNVPGIMTLAVGDRNSVGEPLCKDKRIPLISATGSVKMGKAVGTTVAKRLGRSILELGGNNAVIVMEDADLDLAKKMILFGAVGTAGQRCTTTRRLFVHEKVASDLLDKLLKAYKNVTIGNPLDEKIFMGPLIDQSAVEDYLAAIEILEKSDKADIIIGGKKVKVEGKGYYVEPTIVKVKEQIQLMKEETFAPILYVKEIKTIDEAINLQNAVPQGLSSSIFSYNLKYIEQFLCSKGSDCGIANVNVSTSGAEIGGAFGGEKETGGGREAGSDAWKGYMRRQTVTINWATQAKLAQGVDFGLEED